MPGTLFVVGTPIGNLEDLTFRALRVLREVDRIAAEDTRRTAHLLARYEVRKPVVSLREHNELRETPRLVARLQSGESIALVSDAGTPGISDPGARLVAACRQEGVPIVAIPGPSAVTAALSISGFAADHFAFMGFPPSSGKARQLWLTRLADETRPVVFFESPHRIVRTIEDLCSVKRPIVIHRELTKIHEISTVCHNTGPIQSIVEKGEYTIVVGPADKTELNIDKEDVYSLYVNLVDGVPLAADQAMRLVAMAFDTDVGSVSKIIKKIKISVKQQKKSTA